MARMTLGLVLSLGLAAPLAAQVVGGERPEPGRTVTVIPGVRYRAGPVHRLLLGSHHRRLWATPLRVTVLDTRTFAGGLTPTQCGGRRQTKSLRFEGADRRMYVFRSVDKDPTLALPPELRRTFARELIQDQISSAHPAAPLVVAPLLAATGVLHVEPQLVAMPDDPAIRGFDCVAPGMLGMLEERPTEGPDNEPTFPGAADLGGTAKLFDRLEDDPDHQIDTRAFLAARLMDVYVGDWDRHQDQWRWARFDENGRHRWRPIPRDRDQAFARLDGFLVWLTGFYQPQVVGFGDAYPSLFRVTLAGQVLDRRLLVGLDRRTWDSVAAALTARLTDSVIRDAVGRLPPEYQPQSAANLTRALLRRRDRLPEAAARFYRLVAEEVDVHGTDKRDLAAVERLPGGRAAVRLSRRSGGEGKGEGEGEPYFRRVFLASETGEIRVYLHGGDDRAVVRGGDGSGGGPLLRVIGGGGDDELVDSSRAGTTRFYDDRGANRFVARSGTGVDRRPYDAPPPDSSTLGRPRDWGVRWVPLTWVSVAPELGLLVGGGFTRTGYAFRTLPYSSRFVARAAYATAARTYRAEVSGESRRWLAPAVLTLELRASRLEVLRFYGFGNATDASRSDATYQVRQQQFLVASAVTFSLARAAWLSVGPVLKFADTDLEPGTVIDSLRPYGVGSFGQVGGQVRLVMDTRDRRAAASRGVRLELGGVAYPASLDVTEPFGTVRGEAAAYASTDSAATLTLAVRAGGAKVFGTAPFHEAAYIGGATTVRGFREHRFAGDGALYGNGELRLRVGAAYLLVPMDIGVFGLGDVGRVYRDGETSSRWHTGVGGGIWIAFLSRVNTVTVAVATSRERTGVYIRAGFMF